MAEEKKSGKFMTSIIIGGALGSFAAWIFSNKKRRNLVSEKLSQYYQNTVKPSLPPLAEKRSWWKWFFLFLFLGILIGTSLWFGNGVKADEKGKLMEREKNVTLLFNAANPEGSVDLKKIVEEQLIRPDECLQDQVICQIQEVAVNLHIKKSWKKFNIPSLTNQEFATIVPMIKNNADQLTKPEILILQEILSRRGLLTSDAGNPVKERGFFGSLTWMGVLRLAKIKGADPGDPKFYRIITEKVNQLISNMAKDQNYTENRPLPVIEAMEPQKGDKTYPLWEKNSYLSELSQNAQKIDPGIISVEGNTDVKIEGYVNVERVNK